MTANSPKSETDTSIDMTTCMPYPSEQRKETAGVTGLDDVGT